MLLTKRLKTTSSHSILLYSTKYHIFIVQWQFCHHRKIDFFGALPFGQAKDRRVWDLCFVEYGRNCNKLEHNNHRGKGRMILLVSLFFTSCLFFACVVKKIVWKNKRCCKENTEFFKETQKTQKFFCISCIFLLEYSYILT